MKNEVKVKNLKILKPPTGAMAYLPIIGMQIILIAFLFLNENVLYTFLLLIGALALAVGLKKSRLQNNLKRINN